jgi:hypothetical protein
MVKNLACTVLACAGLVLTSCSDSEGFLLTPWDPPERDPACSDNTGNRFVDCGNGTVTDTQTGLIWLKNANCFGLQDWHTAQASAASLQTGICGLRDGSLPGDWRLPTLGCPSGDSCISADATGEFATIFAQGCMPAAILDTAGTGCWSENDPFSEVQTEIAVEFTGGIYWAATTDADDESEAWNAYVAIGNNYTVAKWLDRHAWPVRGP